MNRLLNKTALITGGNSGIGLATAKAFITEGAKVIITARKQDMLDEVLKELGEKAKGILSDTTSMADIMQLREKAAKLYPTIDILFINAGMAKPGPMEAVTEHEFDEQFNTNVKGAYFTIQQLLPLMREGSTIILNCSVNAHIGRPGISVYSASKAALLSLTKTLSAELLPRKIRVNGIAPGPIDTPFRSKFGISDSQVAQAVEEAKAQVPIQRLGTAEEIARTVVFFASDESAFMLGAELIVAGGLGTL